MTSTPNDPTTGERHEAEVDSGAENTAPEAGLASEGTSAPASADAQALAAAQAEVLDLQDQLARSKADVYNTEQRFNLFVKRSREQEAAARSLGQSDAIDALIPVLDDVELARQHGELTGPFAAIADKLEAALAAKFGLERYGVPGDEFDPNLHEALMHTEQEGVETASIAMVAQPGYRRGETVIRPARVGVVGPA